MKPSTIRLRIAAVNPIPLPDSEESDALSDLLSVIERAAGIGAKFVVAPECGNPAGLLNSAEDLDRPPLRSRRRLSDLISRLREACQLHSIFLAFGFIEEERDYLFNAAALIDQEGSLLGIHRKNVLWQSDHHSYRRGDEFVVHETGIGRVGILISADIHAPEAIATLVEQGAQLVAMPAWSLDEGSSVAQHRGPSPLFMLRSRAAEFGITIVAAGKFRPESPSARTEACGATIDRRGRIVAPSDGSGHGVVVADVELARPHPISVASQYGKILLSSDYTGLEARAGAANPLACAVVGRSPDNDDAQPSSEEPLLRRLAALGADVVVIDCEDEQKAGRVARLAGTFGLRSVTWPESSRPVEIGGIACGTLTHQGLMRFPPARALALQGALILFVLDARDDENLLRTRAIENKVWVAAAGVGIAAIVDPQGRLISKTSTNPDLFLMSLLDTSLAVSKLAAPRTDLFSQRTPSAYRWSDAR
jgi:predicted amidohydrolase